MINLSCFKNYWQLFIKRFKNAFPTILFYIFQFLFVEVVFGSEYVMVVACTTTIFQLRRNLANKLIDYLIICITTIILSFLAFAASQTLELCILINFIVTFFLVFIKCSQFTPKEHMGYAFTFVFLQLRPPTWEQLPTEIFVVVLCNVFLVIALFIYSRYKKISFDYYERICKSLDLLAKILDDIADGKITKTISEELYNESRTFHMMGYKRRQILQLPDRKKRIYHLSALLFQRVSYLIIDKDIWYDDKNFDYYSEELHKLSEIVRELKESTDIISHNKLNLKIKQLLNSSVNQPHTGICIFSRSVLHIIQLLSYELSQSKHSTYSIKVPWDTVWYDFKQQFSRNQFQFRFALRLAIVMTISYTVSFVWNFEHTYWFPLHSFLLLQPSYEESTHRLLTRPIGTAIGCLVVHLMYPHLNGIPGIFMFSLVMIALMYCSTPGTWIQPIFSTAFAIAMASITVQEVEAIQLRLLYLLMAMILVLTVNYFVLPNKKEGQFQRNLMELYKLQSKYWEVIRRSLHQAVDLGQFSELLAQFHMIYHEIFQYIKQQPSDVTDKYQNRLLVLWHMFSELEQIEGLIQAGILSNDEKDILDMLSIEIQKRIYPPEKIDSISIYTLPKGPLKDILRRYLKNAVILFSTSDDVIKNIEMTLV